VPGAALAHHAQAGTATKVTSGPVEAPLATQIPLPPRPEAEEAVERG
jgi:hypothetical protein